MERADCGDDAASAGADAPGGPAIEAQHILWALAALSPEQQAALVQVCYLGRTVREAARVIGVPEGVVRSRLYYGLNSLRMLVRRGHDQA